MTVLFRRSVGSFVIQFLFGHPKIGLVGSEKEVLASLEILTCSTWFQIGSSKVQKEKK